MTGRVAIVLAALLLASLAFGPRAEAFIYWADAEGDRIGRANNDGTVVDRDFISVNGSPSGLAIHGGRIYWGNIDTRTIGRAQLDGSGAQQNFIPNASPLGTIPRGVAVDEDEIWWANFTFNTESGSIGRADANGANPNSAFFTPPFAENPCGVALRAELLYWGNAGADPDPAIGRGGAPPPPPPDPDFVPETGIFPCWPAVSGSHIYWANQTVIGRAELDDGSNSAGVLVTNAHGGLTIFGTKLYFANGLEGTISRADLDGSGAEFAMVTRAGGPNGIAVDSGSAAPNGGGGGCDLTLGKAKKNKRKGSAKLTATVGCAGTLTLGGKGVKPAEEQAARAGDVKLPVKAKGGKKKKLRKKGKAKVNAEVTFTPNAGAPLTEAKKVKLAKR